MESTEILDRSENGAYKWSINRDYNFSPTGDIFGYSMVNVPQTKTNEEYLLLIGGCYSFAKMKTNSNVYSDKVRVNSESALVRVRINDIWPNLEYNFFLGIHPK